MELNPEHPVTRAAHGEWHKVAALLMRKLKQTHVEITLAEVEALAASPLNVVVLNADDKKITLDLVDLATAQQLAARESN